MHSDITISEISLRLHFYSSTILRQNYLLMSVYSVGSKTLSRIDDRRFSVDARYLQQSLAGVAMPAKWVWSVVARSSFFVRKSSLKLLLEIGKLWNGKRDVVSKFWHHRSDLSRREIVRIDNFSFGYLLTLTGWVREYEPQFRGCESITWNCVIQVSPPSDS